MPLPVQLQKLPRRLIKASRLIRVPAWRRAMLRGIAASLEHDELPLRASYATIIDVGAHKGQFALWARERFPGATLHCFEPLSGPAARLRSLHGHDALVRLHPYALASQAAETTINVSGHDDSSSLLEITALQASNFPGTQKVGEESIITRRLDEALMPSELARPVLLKIDTQGSELDVLSGAGDLLRSIDTVLVECSFVEFYKGQALFGDVAGFLFAQGFGLIGGSLSSRQGKRWEQGDFVFERSA